MECQFSAQRQVEISVNNLSLFLFMKTALRSPILLECFTLSYRCLLAKSDSKKLHVAPQWHLTIELDC